MAKQKTGNIVYHIDHIPAEVKKSGNYEYTPNWNEVTDQVALKKRQKSLTEAGDAAAADSVGKQIESATEPK